jgi:hypothetical protein
VCVCVIQWCYGTTEPETEKSNANLLLLKKLNRWNRKSRKMLKTNYKSQKKSLIILLLPLNFNHSRFIASFLYLEKFTSFAIILGTVIVVGGEKKKVLNDVQWKKIGPKRENSLDKDLKEKKT